MAVYSPSSFVGEHLWHVSRMNPPLGHYSNSRASHICMRSSKKVNKVFACLIFQTWNRSKPTGGSNLKQVGNDRNRNRVCVLNWKPTELNCPTRSGWFGGAPLNPNQNEVRIERAVCWVFSNRTTNEPAEVHRVSAWCLHQISTIEGGCSACCLMPLYIVERRVAVPICAWFATAWKSLEWTPLITIVAINSGPSWCRFATSTSSIQFGLLLEALNWTPDSGWIVNNNLFFQFSWLALLLVLLTFQQGTSHWKLPSGFQLESSKACVLPPRQVERFHLKD